jgi:hypothetical protein
MCANYQILTACKEESRAIRFRDGGCRRGAAHEP